MKTSAPRFHVDTLKQIAGAKAFARGEAYFRDGHVRLLAVEKERIVAEVAGTEDYRTVASGTGASFDGECSCPAYGDWGVCKHMVATALAANESRPKAGGETGVLDRIRKHLSAQSPEALVAMIVEIATNDADLFRRLELASAVEGEMDDAALEKRLRRAIDKATAVRDYVDYRAARGWAAGVRTTLDALAAPHFAGRAAVVMRLAEHALERIAEASGSIDDSDGHTGALAGQAQELHLAAARTAKPDPRALARWLYLREIDDVYGAFYRACDLYAEALGEVGRAEYRRLAESAWKELPPVRSGSRDTTVEWRRGHLMEILDRFAEDERDVEARIALRAACLSAAHDYTRLAEFCLEVKREADALRWAEEGLWVFEDGRPDERLLFLAVRLLRGQGKHADAAAHLWRAFAKAPSLEIYRLLRGMEGETGRDRALAQLSQALSKAGNSSWHSPADLLVRIFMEEQDFAAAWPLARRHRISMSLESELARVSEATHPGEAIRVYAAAVERLAASGGNPAYAEAKELVARIARLQGRDEHRSYLAGVKERHARKRNFMKLLA